MSLSASLNFFFQFAKSGAGVTGKSGSITVTVKKLTRSSSPTITTVSTGGAITVGSVTEVDSTNNKGLYVVGVSGLDPAADYLATAHYTGTSTDVDNVDVPALWSEFSASINGGAVPQMTAGTASGGLPTLDANGDISAKLGAAAQVTSLQIRYGITGTVWIVDPIRGSDSNTGTWASPFATILPTAVGGAHAASAGDLVFVCAGTCAVGATWWQMPAGVTLAGAGMDQTIITGSYNPFGNTKGTLWANTGTICDLTVQTVSADGVFQLPISDQSGTTSLLIERVRVIGITDALYCTNATNVLVRRCELISNWDCIFAQSSAVNVVVEDTTLFTKAHNATSTPNANSTVQCSEGAQVTLVRCPAQNIAIDTNASRVTKMIHAEHVSTAGSRITLIDSPIYLNVDGATIGNLVTDSGTFIVAENSPYDPTKVITNGTLSEVVPDVNVSSYATNQDPGTYLTNQGYTAARAVKLDDLDATVSSRLAASSYVAPDNADIVTALSDLVTLLGRTDPTTAVNAIKAVTDKLTFDGSNNVKSTPQTAVTVGTNNDKTGYSLSVAPPTAVQIATQLWQDLTAGSDFTTNGSIGKELLAFITEWNAMVTANQFTSGALANAPTGGGGGGLSGPSSVTLTFVDADSNPVPNVEFTLVGIGSGRANASGVATFGAQNGSYTVAAAITAGMLFGNTSLTVNGTTTQTITGNAISFVVGPPNTTTVYLTTRTISGAAQSGVIVQFELTTPPAGATGDAFNEVATQVTSDVNGLVQIALPIGWGFEYWTTTGSPNSAIVPTSGPYALPDLLGSYS